MTKEPSKPGVRECMSCKWLFVSPDVERIRRCADCKNNNDQYEPRHSNSGLSEAAVLSDPDS